MIQVKIMYLFPLRPLLLHVRKQENIVCRSGSEFLDRHASHQVSVTFRYPLTVSITLNTSLLGLPKPFKCSGNLLLIKLDYITVSVGPPTPPPSVFVLPLVSVPPFGYLRCFKSDQDAVKVDLLNQQIKTSYYANYTPPPQCTSP